MIDPNPLVSEKTIKRLTKQPANTQKPHNFKSHKKISVFGLPDLIRL
jgi:hypothetical protein